MKMITKTMVAAVLATSSGIASALEDISANATLATDYVFRGVSQTDNKATVQGGMDWGYDFEPVRWYVGAWGSNIDSDFFADDPVMELDIYTGLSGEFKDFSYDVGWLRYFYPTASINNTTEWHAGGGWKWFGATVYYSKDWFATDESAGRLEGTFDYELPYEIGFSASVANNYGDGNDDIWSDSYVDWSIGVSKTWLGADWGLTYTDTDINSSDCKAVSVSGDDDICGSIFTLSLSKSF
jgi:uncharacterized protein (TIGR02001 family)